MIIRRKQVTKTNIIMEVVLGSEAYTILLYDYLKKNNNITSVQYDDFSVVFMVPRNSNFINGYLESFRKQTPGIDAIEPNEKQWTVNQNLNQLKHKRKCWSCMD